jgi:hypothetical protein
VRGVTCGRSGGPCCAQRRLRAGMAVLVRRGSPAERSEAGRLWYTAQRRLRRRLVVTVSAARAPCRACNATAAAPAAAQSADALAAAHSAAAPAAAHSADAPAAARSAWLEAARSAVASPARRRPGLRHYPGARLVRDPARRPGAPPAEGGNGGRQGERPIAVYVSPCTASTSPTVGSLWKAVAPPIATAMPAGTGLSRPDSNHRIPEAGAPGVFARITDRRGGGWRQYRRGRRVPPGVNCGNPGVFCHIWQQGDRHDDRRCADLTGRPRAAGSRSDGAARHVEALHRRGRQARVGRPEPARDRQQLGRARPSRLPGGNRLAHDQSRPPAWYTACQPAGGGLASTCTTSFVAMASPRDYLVPYTPEDGATDAQAAASSIAFAWRSGRSS